MTAGSPVGAAAFSPDGRRIVGGGEQVQLWNTETGKALQTLPGYKSSYVNASALSPDGRLLAVPGSPVRVYDLNTKKELFTIPTGARTVAFSPDGARIATGGFDVAGVWDAVTADLLFLAGHPFGADSAAFSIIDGYFCLRDGDWSRPAEGVPVLLDGTPACQQVHGRCNKRP